MDFFILLYVIYYSYLWNKKGNLENYSKDCLNVFKNKFFISKI